MRELAGNRQLVDSWAVLRRRRWIVALSLAATMLIALIGSFLVTPLYRATVTLQIERQNPDILNIHDLSKVDYSWAAYADFYQTQYKILSSLDVARIAVERAGLDSHPAFEPKPDEGPGLWARLGSLLPRRASRAAPADPLDVVAARLRAGLEISPVRNSQLVLVSWVSEDPELAAAVASAIAEAYVQFRLESQFATSDQAREFLVDQIATLKREITAIEEHLQGYGEAKGILSIDDTHNITLQALRAIADERTAAHTRLARARARLEAVTAVEPEALGEVLQSDLISRLRQEYATYEIQYSEKVELFKSDWPDVMTLRSKLEQARERLELETLRIAAQVRAAADAEHRDAAAAAANLDRLVIEQEAAAQRLKRDAVEYATLESEVAKKRETLAALMQRQNEMSLSTRLVDLADTGSNVRIMERARVPAAPFRPRVGHNLILGALIGLSLGVGLAFLLDHLDNTIMDVPDLKRTLALPVLGVIPRHATAGTANGRGRRRSAPKVASFDGIAHHEPHCGVSEAYRALRTSILLSHPGQPPARLMVTSALPEEGKTATVVNLAIVLAQLERRVLVVDTDLRRPRLHRAFGLENTRGISTYLSGLAADPGPLVVRTQIGHLDLLPSGPIPPNPSELLNSRFFASLGQELLERGYDHVLFDSPPLLSVSDPVIIASVVDLAILVVRASSTPRPWVRAAAERLQQNRGRLCGVVFNALDADRTAPYTYPAYGLRESDERPRAVTPDERRASGGAG
jgi:capsular exopolysaccharide synthesis family protein